MAYTATEKACSKVPDEEKAEIGDETFCTMANQAFSDAAKLYFCSKHNDQVYATISFLPPREVWILGPRERPRRARRLPCKLQFYVEQSVGPWSAIVSSLPGDSSQQPSSFNTVEILDADMNLSVTIQ
jgi:hypothetical protein